MKFRVVQVPVPSRARELARLERVDYADAFAVDVAVRHTPEEWIRISTEASPALFSPISVTDVPRSATAIAAARPIKPPPTTMTSVLSLIAPSETDRESVA